jgi:hypothetical protein
MSIKSKIINVMAAHPKIATFAIGLGITMAIGTAIGMLDHSQIAFAASSSGGSSTSGASGA